MIYPKFIWLPAVLEEARFTHAQARVLTYCGVVSVDGADNTFKVRQSTVAEKLHLSRKAVNEAFGAARQLGYVRPMVRRRRGPGWHEGDTYELTLPSCHPRLELCNPSGTQPCNPPVTQPENDVTDGAELGNPPRQSCVTHGAELCNPDNAPTSGNAVPKKGIDEGLSEGCSAKGVAREPAHRAEEIVYDFVEGCNRKGGARRLVEAYVVDALRAGLDEDRIVDVITRWQPTGFGLNRRRATASPYVLKKMLDNAVEGAP